MANRKPTQAQAQLHLQLYDLRRETRLRQAREWFIGHYFPTTPEETQRLAPPGSPENASLRMVVSYWDQACALLDYGLLHEELFFQTTNEFFFVWERLQPFAAEGRKLWRNPRMWENLEKAARRYEKWVERRAPGHIAMLREYMEQVRKASAASRAQA